MATDITTLAIALQSKEAESNLKVFNELLESGSDKAKRMERMTIGVDVNEALKELAALKAGYDDIAKSAENIHFDLGMNMPSMFAPPEPTIDTTALEDLKTFFQTAADEMRKQSELVSESMERMGVGAEHAVESVRTSGESMRGATAAAGEYAEKVRELATAKKELEKLSAKADADGQASYNADQKAREAKHDLLVAERELQKVSEQLNATHTGGAGNIMELASKEDALKQEVNSLSEAYKKAQAEADKFNAKLDVSAGKADEARARYNQLKDDLAGIPAPAGAAGKAVNAFSLGAKQAGTTITKLGRGITSVARYSGLAVPGLAGLGRTVGMFSITGPYVGAAIIGVTALAGIINKLRGQSEKEAQIIRENADKAIQAANAAKNLVSESESDWTRLGELSNIGNLTNAQNKEATAIIERLTEVYGDLGLEIDKTTGKMTGYAEARMKANAQDQAFMRAILEDAQKAAQEKYGENIGNLKYRSEGLADTAEMNRLFDSVIGNLNGNGGDTAKLRDLQETIAMLRRAANGSEEYRYSHTQTVKGQTPGSEFTATTERVLDKDAAADALKRLESLRDDFVSAHNAKRNLEKFDTSDIEKYGKEAGKISASLHSAESKFAIDEYGKMRLKTEDEIYRAQKSRIEEIEAERKSVSQKAAGDEMAILDNGKQAGIYLKELELERSNLLEKTLTYEQRIADEKARQTKALNDAINAEQTRLNALELGYKTDQEHNLLRKKNADELAQDRAEDIKALQELISEKGYGETLEEQKELVAARLKLAQLQSEDLKYRDQITAAGKQNENARKGYVFDDRGAVLRRKTEDELLAEQKKEIEAARKRVAETQSGTLERENAEAELTRLEIEAFNMRKKNNTADMLNEARANNSRLVQGIEARSSAALALEARSFRRDDSETAILKDTKEVQTDIKEAVTKLLTGFTDFTSTFSDVKNLLQPL
ncbi:MAG: hypothetical protein PUC15_08110 [Lentisphaeria bacterium]|nr:hypothetical protein [Lentisphaeria bacterium]